MMVAVQTKALAANLRNAGEWHVKDPGKMRTEERGKKEEYEGRLEANGGH